jgi:uncharacterized membrane protein YdbT with pleckstrin-like domain
MNIIHEETQKFNVMMGLLIVLSFVIIGAYLVITWSRGGLAQLPNYLIAMLIVILIFDLFFIINFYQLKTVVTDDTLIFGFGVLKRKVKLEEIEQVEVEKFVFNKYMGYGIRTGKDRSVGYIARAGQGIRVKVRNKKDFYITSEDANRLKTMIDTAGKKTAGVSH